MLVIVGALTAAYAAWIAFWYGAFVAIHRRALRIELSASTDGTASNRQHRLRALTGGTLVLAGAGQVFVAVVASTGIWAGAVQPHTPSTGGQLAVVGANILGLLLALGAPAAAALFGPMPSLARLNGADGDPNLDFAPGSFIFDELSAAA